MYIFTSPGLASRRRRPLSSNVRPGMATFAAIPTVLWKPAARAARHLCGIGMSASGFVSSRQCKAPSLFAATRAFPAHRDSQSETLHSCVPRSDGIPPLLHLLPGRAASVAHHQDQSCPPRTRRAWPNTSFEARPNGKPPGPGHRYGVHFLWPGPGVLPLVPPQLKR